MHWTQRQLSALVITGTLVGFSFASPSLAKESEHEEHVKGSISTKGLKRQDYIKLAKVSSTEASAAAQANQPGKVLSTKIENEDGFLIYAVEILSKDGTKHEVLIDAGNAKVLKASIDSDEDDENED